VTYNSAEWIGPCARACPVTPVVVDNASGDGSADVAAAAGARVIVNRENRGFAAAVNQGIRAAPGELILLLNPDARITSDLVEMVAAFADPQVGAVGGRLLAEDGRDQAGFTLRNFPTPLTLVFETLGVNRLWPGNPVNRRYRLLDRDLSQAQEAEQPAGAFLMVRRTAWEQIGGFDERFQPVWYEDVDFCLRLKQAGWRIRYVPGAQAIHAGGHSVGRLPDVSKRLYWYGSLLKYASKNFSGSGARFVALSVFFAAWLRAIVGIAHSQPMRALPVYGRVAKLAWRSMIKGESRSGPWLL
jgi:GT2 family glycosyltransferase